MANSYPHDLENSSDLNPDQDIAIVGMACRFAQAPNVDAFWQNIVAGKECFSEIPKDRWDNDAFYSPVPRNLDKTYVQKGAFIENVRDFAAMHYGIAPKRVQGMDPQHRLLMDTARAALQDAGLERFDFETGFENGAGFNPDRMGTFLGLSSSEYRDILGMRTMALGMASGIWGNKPDQAALKPLLDSVENLAPLSAFSMPGTLLNMAAASIAHQWGLGGPAFSIDAACASALVAVTDAVTYLRAGLCDSAVAGGAYLNLTPLNLVCFSRIGAISKQGRCRPFDAQADGFLQGDGSGIIVLKRLSTALEDGDRVHAVIRGVGINNDGNGSPGPMAPSPAGQLSAIQKAHEDAGFDPATIEFVECHGTATPVGDPVEVGALEQAMCKDASAPEKVWLSSVKANIGHTMSAAGIAGLIKAVMVMKHGVIPPQAAFENPHPKLGLDDTPFDIAREQTPWVRGNTPRRAAVSSFGFGGTNCHVVLEEATPAKSRPAVYVSGWTQDVSPAHALVVTGPSLDLLGQHALELAEAVQVGFAKHGSIEDIAGTLNTTRKFERFRAVIVAANRDEFVTQLQELSAHASNGVVPGILGPDLVLVDHEAQKKTPRLAWMFPGQGAQRVGLLRGLYERSAQFKETLDSLAQAVESILPKPLLTYLYPELDGTKESLEAAEDALKATQVCQPTMAALGLALGQFLESLGIDAEITLGHSLGEFVAAASGGILSESQTLQFVAKRGKLMAELELNDFGAMAASMAGRSETEAVIAKIDGVEVANINHPRQTVISGTTAAVERAVEELKAAKIAAKLLRVSHAFHSPVVEGVTGDVDQLIEELEILGADKVVVSAITANPYNAAQGEDSIQSVFSRHATAPVDFVGCLETALEEGANVFLEVGAGKTLTSFAKGTLSDRAHVVQLHHSKHDGERTLMRALGQLFSLGCDIQWEALYPSETNTLVTLPETLLEKEPYWVVQEKVIALRPANVTEDDLAAPAAESKATGEQAQLVELFREQASILATHAEILAQQTAILSGGTGEVDFAAARQNLNKVAVTPNQESIVETEPVAKQAAPVTTELNEWALDAVLKIVSELVSDVSAFPASALKPTQRLSADLGFDSLMFVELSSKVDARFKELEGGIPQSLMSEQTSIEDIAAHLTQVLNQSDSAGDEVINDVLMRYQPVLSARPISLLPASPERLGDLVLLTRDSGGVADATALVLKDFGLQVVLIDSMGTPGDAEGPLSEDILHWQLNPTSVDALFETLGKHQLLPDSVLHFAGLDACAKLLESGGSKSDLSSSIEVAYKLASGLHKTAPNSAKAFVCLTGLGGHFGLEPGDYAERVLQQSGLVGFTKALAKEWPHALVKAIDIDPSDAGLAEQITAELFCADREVEVGFTGGRRQVVSLEPVADVSADGHTIGKDDVIVITGGGRGLGAKTALHFAKKYQCGLVLTGRSDSNDAQDITKTLADIESLGSRATYIRWDVQAVMSADQLDAVKSLGPVTGVIHCAGVIRDKRIEDKTISDLRTVFNTKALGLLNTMQALEHEPLRFMVGYSSWSGRFGNVGQTDYSAANEWLNRALTFVGRERKDLCVTSVMWPPWEDSSMAQTIPSPVRKAMESQGVRFLQDDEGFELLDEVLSSGTRGEVLVGGRVALETSSLATSEVLSTLTHPYLEDHRLKGEPVMPLAVALDQVCQVALELCDNGVHEVRDLKLYQGVVANSPVLLEGETSSSRHDVDGVLKATWELKQTVEDGKKALAYKAQIESMADWQEEGETFAVQPSVLPELPLALEDFYAEHTFHGPLLHGVESITAMDQHGVKGLVKTSKPSDWVPMSIRSAWAVDPLVVDGSFQLVAYWMWHFHKKAAFPVGFGRFIHVKPFSGDTIYCHVVSVEVGDSSFTGSIRYTDANGDLFAILENVEAQVFESASQESTSEADDSVSEVQDQHYKVEAFPEVQAFAERLKMTEAMGLQNPFFSVHEGTARDVSVVAGHEMVNFSSYNYLGYSGHPQVVQAAQDAIARYGTSVSASRVASGERPLHGQLEEELAKLLQVESALIFSSGHHTNESVIGHLFGEKDLIVHDSLAHNSIMQGALLSGAKRRPFHHDDWEELDKILSQLRPHFEKCVIAIEGVYSMDGDIANLPRFIEMRDKYKCLLFVDEAHSAGVLGGTGGGIREHFGTRGDQVDIWMGTLSKSFASCGGYIGASAALVEYLKYTTPGFVFSAGISPANSAAALEAIRLMNQEPENVKRLQHNSEFFLKALKAHGIDTGFSEGSAVVPCIVGNSMKSLQLSESLRVKGINVQPIVYPAVDEDAARLRFFLSSLHTEDQLRFTADTLAQELRALEVLEPSMSESPRV
ncbi:MAG: aminotransferase class I/II-fold pyridoxal phosphate-dependent enzyme [Deltaproteobacteria bacterium]|nr:aminotransferase class I/II-fold pyridoxal phosphate-dependent enzyme [Deltaproteobacteria bacterium]